MPCYRTTPAHLEKSVKSILSQTYGNLELIVVVDPCSPKIDSEIIWALDGFKDDKRLKIILHEKRAGLVNSLNEAILLAKGEYVARADADDINMSPRIEEQVNFMQNNGYGFVGSWALLIDENDRIISQIKKPITPNEIRTKIMLHNPFLHPTVIIKKKIFENVGLYDIRFEFTEDYELWSRIISEGYLCANLPKFLVMLRETKISITRGSTWLKNRHAYLNCKMYAHKRYAFKTPRDNVYLALTPLALLVHPKMYFAAQKILGHLSK
jgi:glycosyltransferase involved in cell wall biosynthesis